MAIWIILGVGVLLLLWGISVYNGLVRLKNAVKNALAQIDVQLKRRYDLIPNLVETAKGYMAHEKDTLEAVIKARNQAHSLMGQLNANPGSPEAMKGLVGAEAMLSAGLGKLFALSESYPDLKANTTMQQLMEELTSTENRIGFARQAYNDSVMEYNTAREIFPNSLVVGFGPFPPFELWKVENPVERERVEVSFSKK